MHLSVIIPAFNEEERIGDTLRKINGYLSRQPYESEVIVVDDGSTDGTVSAVQTLSPDTRLISYRQNRGKGHAVRTGMLAACGDYRLFYDADGSTPIEELDKVWGHFEAGADIVIGSRALPESEVQVHQVWYREKMGRVFNMILKLMGLTHFPDTQCGFKVFSRNAAEAVFPLQTVERFSFDAEILYLAEKKGLRIEQAPIRWINCPHTRLSAGKDSLRMFIDIVRVRFRSWGRRIG